MSIELMVGYDGDDIRCGHSRNSERFEGVSMSEKSEKE